MRRDVLTVLCLLASATPSLAAQATAEGAQRLIDNFHSHFGTPRTGETDRLRVTPEGEAYRLNFDVAGLMDALLPDGFSVEAPEVSVLAQPLPDATWRVSELALPSPLTFSLVDQKLTYRWEGVTFEGIFDPALASFTTFNETIATSISEMRGAEGASTSFMGEQVASGNAADAGDGKVDLHMQQTMRDVVVQETIALPDADGAPSLVPPIEFAYSIDNATIGTTVTDLDSVGLLDLSAAVVANMQAGGADSEALKDMLGALMPLFSKLDESISVAGLRVGTPLGDFSMDQASVGLSLPGLVENGAFALSLAFGGATYPETLAPWILALAPTDLDLGLVVFGLNLDMSARYVLAAFDANASPHVETTDLTSAAMLLLPEAGATLTLRSGHIHGPTLDIAFEGEIALAADGTAGSIKVTVTGLDKAIAPVMSVATSDPLATRALGILSIADLWGHKTDTGATEFIIAVNPDGSITVNGQTVKPPNGNPT